MRKKKVSRREALKTAGAITASAVGANLAMKGEQGNAPPPPVKAEPAVPQERALLAESTLSPEQQALEKLWEEHLASEFKATSAAAAINTMVERPGVNHVPVMTGGVGRKQLAHFTASTSSRKCLRTRRSSPSHARSATTAWSMSSYSSSPIPCKWIGFCPEFPRRRSRLKS